MYLAHVDRFVDGMAAAAVIARVLADAAGGGGQRVVHHHGNESVFQALLLEELQEARDVHVQRATVFARGQRQVFADSRAAALGANVIFEFVPEMAHGGEHGIGRALAQAAQGSIADHAAHFVQAVEIGGGGVAVGEGVQNAQRLIQADAAGDAFAAGFRVGEFDEVAGHVHHAVVFIHDHHAAGTHDGA